MRWDYYGWELIRVHQKHAEMGPRCLESVSPLNSFPLEYERCVVILRLMQLRSITSKSIAFHVPR